MKRNLAISSFVFLVGFLVTVFILNILVTVHTLYTYEINRILTKEKVVMLTFDDGPDAADLKILDILEREKVPGMFFQTGQNIEKKLEDPQLVSLEQRIIEGSSLSWIGSHTYSHDRYLHHPDKAVGELNHTFALLQKVYGDLGIQINQELVPTRLAYLQYFNGMDYIGQKSQNKYFIRGYLGTDYDEEQTGEETILKQYLSHLKPGQIFVCHTRAYAQVWLPKLITELKNRGYQFASFNPHSPTYYKNFGSLGV